MEHAAVAYLIVFLIASVIYVGSADCPPRSVFEINEAKRTAGVVAFLITGEVGGGCEVSPLLGKVLLIL